jgi:plasmid stabilization system protein ParE
MALEIKWSKTSRDDLYKITTYLEEFLSDIEFVNYVDNVFDCLNTIASFPQIGIVANKKKS